MKYSDKIKRLVAGCAIRYIFPKPATDKFTSIKCIVRKNAHDRIYVEGKDINKAKCLVVIPLGKNIVLNNIKFLKSNKTKGGVDEPNKKYVSNRKKKVNSFRNTKRKNKKTNRNNK